MSEAVDKHTKEMIEIKDTKRSSSWRLTPSRCSAGPYGVTTKLTKNTKLTKDFLRTREVLRDLDTDE